MTVEPDTSTIIDELSRAWAKHDLDDLSSDAVKNLTAGSATDWGMPANAHSSIKAISLGSGIPDPDTLPRVELLAAMKRVLQASEDSALRYGGGIGYEPLRAALADRYTRDRHVPVDASYFLLTNGSAGAIDLVCSAFLSPGDIVIAEAPTFSGSLRTFRGHRADIISVGMDEEGLDTNALSDLLERLTAEGKRAKLIYTISNFHNPAGSSMSVERRKELLVLAANHGALIIDDDAYGEFSYSDNPATTLSELAKVQGVITVSTFSKIMATGLRVGWIHAEPALIERVIRIRFEMGNSPLLHQMLYEFMKNGRLDEHIVQMRQLYSEKRDALISALHEYCEPYLSFRKPAGGFFLWATLHEGLNALEVHRAATANGVYCAYGDAFFADQTDPGEHLRLAFSEVALRDIPEAARRLAAACEQVAKDSAGWQI